MKRTAMIERAYAKYNSCAWTPPRTFKAQGGLDIIAGLVDFFIGLILLWIATAIYFTIFVNGSSPLANSPIVVGSNTASHTINHTTGFFNGINNFYAFGFIFFALGSIIAASFTESAPVFAIIGILISPVEILIAFVFHDAFFNIIQSSSVFGALAVQYPLIPLMFQYLPVVTFVCSIIVAVVVFSKNE